MDEQYRLIENILLLEAASILSTSLKALPMVLAFLPLSVSLSSGCLQTGERLTTLGWELHTVLELEFLHQQY